MKTFDLDALVQVFCSQHMPIIMIRFSEGNNFISRVEPDTPR